MESLAGSLSFTLLSWKAASVTMLLYLMTVALYRLIFHPLAKFPGPKLAALTRYYEAYYDVVQNGQYGFQIMKMHEKYGPIVRISPYELHINDPAYFEKLYRHDGVWDKYSWPIDNMNAPGAIVFTAGHNQHKALRQPLNSYFSKTRVASHQSLIDTKVAKLCGRITTFGETERILDLGAAISALQRDVTTDFVLGKDYRSLDADDFRVGMTHVMQGGGEMWRLSKHIPWYGKLMHSIPKDFAIKHADSDTSNFLQYVKTSEEQTDRLLKEAASLTTSELRESSATIVHQIVKSSLRPEDKTVKRVFADVATITGAGFETTASILRLAVYYAYANPSILRRLRAEIDEAMLTSNSHNLSETLGLRSLEQLPYLTAVIMEAMRLSPALGTRLQRIAPDRALIYNDLVIPAGTPVGMTTLFMHMDSRLYPKPHEFNPERWLDDEAGKKTEKVYAPFSRGTRICLGMHFAWAIMYKVISALVHNFDFDFEGLQANHFDFISDQFIIGTRGKAVLETLASRRKL